MKQARDAIIRPKRKKYSLKDLPTTLNYAGMEFIRIPLEFKNNRNQNLVGSLYYFSEKEPKEGDPCVIYLHRNASCQLEGRFLVPNLCPHNIKVFCFDFAGCGESDGDFISLGYYESIDTNFIINTLRTRFGFQKFLLWGRSMGAATSIITNNKFVVAKIADSSYTSIDSMVNSVAKTSDIPSIFHPFAKWFIKNSVDSAADFDFSNVSPLQAIKNEKKPIIIGHAKEDQIVPFEQSHELFDACPNLMKLYMALPGGHNSQRPLEWLRLCISFCIDQLGLPHFPDLKLYECIDLQTSDDHFAETSETHKNESKKKKREDSEDGDDGVRRKRRKYSDDSDS